MADVREVFAVLETDAGAGTAWVVQAEANDVASVGLAPVVTGVDKDAKFVLIPVEIEGEDVGNALPVLGAKDENGKLQYLPMNAGAIVISDNKKGTALRGNDTVTAVVGTMTLVTEVNLTIGKISQEVQAIVANTFSTLWELTSVDNSIETTLARFLTGPGMFSFTFKDENLYVTGGAVTPKLRISGKQFVGAASDMHANVSCYQID